MKTKRHDFSSAFKAKVGMRAIKDYKTIGDLALEYRVPANTILNWKKELMSGSPDLFRDTSSAKKNKAYLDKLNTKISKFEKERTLYDSNIRKIGP